MSVSPTPRLWLRSAGAVVAGLLAVVVPSVVTDGILHATGVFPPVGERMSDGLFLLAAAYRVLYGILGGFVAARLAPRRPMLHALVLGAIGTIASIAGSVAMWDLGPAWYSLSVIAMSIPCCWIGARLRGSPG